MWLSLLYMFCSNFDSFPLLAHSRAWLPPSTGSRSPAQEVHKYAPKNTNGKPPGKVSSLCMAASVFVKPMALRFSFANLALTFSAEVDTMSSRNRRCTIFSRCHLAFDKMWNAGFPQRNAAKWSSKTYSNPIFKAHYLSFVIFFPYVPSTLFGRSNHAPQPRVIVLEALNDLGD